ncbi:helix-turn-helix domain-containing protein [Paenibacillus sp. 2TAB19]|uniref:helix-turn-helix domain-containing protein n=1 Tax=Paenibacillus sp. 2TAB19 TaxID=3233003 RepID=UPI003F9DF2E1
MEQSTRRQQQLYIACEDMDFVWREQDVTEVERLWEADSGLFRIAHEMRREPDEVAVLIIDLSRQQRIKPRRGGIWGAEYFEFRKFAEGR